MSAPTDEATPQAQLPFPPATSGPRKHKRVLLSGYYGFNNYGDDLILESLGQQLQRRGLQVTALSHHPAHTRQQLKLGAVDRYNPLQLLVALCRSQAFLSGGGGLFQDTTGPNSVLYYGGLILLARLFGKTVGHVFQSVGPLKGRFARGFTGFCLRQCHFVMVRDQSSAALVEELTGQKPWVTADAVWALEPQPKPAESSSSFRLGVSLRPHAHLTPQALAQLAASVAQFIAEVTVATRGEAQSEAQEAAHTPAADEAPLLPHPVELVLLPCQSNEDEALLLQFATLVQQQVAKQARGHVKPLLAPVAHLSKAIAGCDVVIGMRYHAIVSALLHHVPVFAVNYDPKVADLAATLGLPTCTVAELEQLHFETLWDAFDQYPPTVANGEALAHLKAQTTMGFNALETLLH